MERLQNEFEAIGFYLSAHPLDAYGAEPEAAATSSRTPTCGTWMRSRGSSRAKLAGLVLSKQERTSAKGNRFAFVQLSDTSRHVRGDGVLRPLADGARASGARAALLLSVDIRSEEDSLRLMVNSVEPLDRAVANTAAGLRIFLRDPGAVSSLRNILATAGKGKGKIELALDVPDRSGRWPLRCPARYAVSRRRPRRGDRDPGVVAVQDT